MSSSSGIDVSLRPCRIDDAVAIHAAVHESMADLTPWMPWCHPGYSTAEARSWLERQVHAFSERRWFEFAIVDGAGRYLGQCGLNQIDALNRRCNLGYWVRSTATRQGVATRAVLLARDWAFQHTDLIRLEVLIAVDNAASLRVAQKAGAVREGVLRQRLLLRGAAKDATMYSFVRP